MARNGGRAGFRTMIDPKQTLKHVAGDRYTLASMLAMAARAGALRLM
jgi:hypothetical protein